MRTRAPQKAAGRPVPALVPSDAFLDGVQRAFNLLPLPASTRISSLDDDATALRNDGLTIKVDGDEALLRLLSELESINVDGLRRLHESIVTSVRKDDPGFDADDDTWTWLLLLLASAAQDGLGERADATLTAWASELRRTMFSE